MRIFALASCLGILGLVSVNAQEVPRFTFDVGAGFTNSVGNTSNQLNDYGWNVGGGAGINVASFLSVKLDVSWNGLGINGPTLANIGAPAGVVHVFGATLDPVVHVIPGHHFDLYLTGGGGIFHLRQDFTQPTIPVSVSDPFFGLYPQPLGGAQMLTNYTVNKPGYDVGAGFAFGGVGHGKFFAEARLEHVFLTNSRMDFLPVTLGFRW